MVRLSNRGKKQKPCNARLLKGVNPADQMSNQMLEELKVLSSIKALIDGQ